MHTYKFYAEAQIDVARLLLGRKISVVTMQFHSGTTETAAEVVMTCLDDCTAVRVAMAAVQDGHAMLESLQEIN